MIKIGVLGAGHLGKIHIKCLAMLQETYECVGFFDPVEAVRKAVSEQFGIPAYNSIDELLPLVDAVDIVTPTTTHFDVAMQAISLGKHIFIEKPITHTLLEAERLMEAANAKGVKVQVGHVERFNPALLALDDLHISPLFIEAHRLATFNPRGTDVSVVLDLMIHDLDIILSMVNSPVKDVQANGVAIVSDTVDIANARITFANGAVANLTASRISLKQMRKVRLFQRDAYLSIDLLDKQAQVVRLLEDERNIPERGQHFPLETPKGQKIIHVDMPAIEQVNAIKMELETFAQSIISDTTPIVSGEDGLRALALAYSIQAAIDAQAALEVQ